MSRLWWFIWYLPLILFCIMFLISIPFWLILGCIFPTQVSNIFHQLISYLEDKTDEMSDAAKRMGIK